ncbi:MAG: RDD family protein [Leptolyngbyaceae cyanobacterium]
MNYAGFWLRFAAAILDGIILYILGSIAGFIVGLIIGILSLGNDPTTLAALLGGLAGLIVGWLYHALQESSSYQATLGKRAVGIVVTDLDGQRISFGTATGRHFAKILSSLILMIGYIMAAFTEKKQALHDIMAGTVVVKKR